MKQLIIFTILFLSFTANAQLKSIDFVSGLNYTYRIENNLDTKDLISRVQGQNWDEKGKLNYLFGVNTTFNLKERLDFKTGLSYTQIGYEKTGDVSFLYCGPGPYITMFTNRYIELPLAIRIYSKETIGIKTYIETGIAFSYLLSHGTYYHHDQENVSRIEVSKDEHNYSQIYVPLICTIGTEYDFKRHTGFAQFVTKTGIFNNENTEHSNTRFFEIGIECGMRINLEIPKEKIDLEF